MADAPGIETYANHTNSVTATPPPTDPGNGNAVRTRVLAFVSIAALSAGVAYGIVRIMLSRVPTDPTTERIQQLIDEANRLLAQLDDKKSNS